MNATSNRDDKMLDPARYMCVWCDLEFSLEGPAPCCPNCGTADRKDLVAIYVGFDDQLQGMYCAIDWHGG